MSRSREGRLRLVGVEIDWAERGPVEGRPLLMIMGLGMQRVAWPDSLFDALVARGFRCISFDNRDVGHSTRYDAYGAPSLPAMLAGRLLRRPLGLPYRLADIADDAAALLQHLGIARADVLGISMGGMVAQHFAHRHPRRTASLSLMCSSSGRLGLPLPRPAVLRHMATRPRGRVSREAAIDYLLRLFDLLASPAYPMPADELRRRAEAAALRAPTGNGVLRQLGAILDDGDRSILLRRLELPALVLHGSADPMLPPAHGEHLARLIPGARLERIAGWGHDLPDALAGRFAELVAGNAARAQEIVRRA